MPPRPARFSRSTKAAKPAAVEAEQQQEQQQQQHGQCASQHHRQHSRTCSVEVVITPSKKRKVVPASNESDHVDAKSLMVTPTKTPRTMASSKINFLPTPPVTPTISVSEHEEEEEIASPSLLTPTSAISSSALQSTCPSPSPSPSSYNANIYAKARSLLRLSAHASERNCEAGPSSSRLVGRTAERKQLECFLRPHFPQFFEVTESVTDEDLPAKSLARKAKAMYISGSPGTGKTALVHDILQHLKLRQHQANSRMAMSLLNCTTVQKPDDIWTRLAEELDLTLPSTSRKGKAKAKWTVDTFQEALNTTQSGRSLVVLDEIDHLLPTTLSASSTSTSSSASNTSNVLGALFSIALDPKSNLVLIGIANALDLTQRYQALLFGNADDEQAAEQEQPELLHFRPFQSEEMVAIVKQRLNTLHSPSTSNDETEGTDPSKQLPLPVISPPALELAAKKVAAVTGDLRSFLSLIRKAVEIFETEQRKRLIDSQSTTSPFSLPGSNNRDPISPTKNILAYRNRKRKLGNTEGDENDDNESKQDPLLKFDALTAPKLSPAHILKATRLVSLVSSSSANNNSAGNAAGIKSSAGSLSASSSSSNTLLQSKIAELNLHQRLALTSFLILLARRISSKVPIWTMAGTEQSSASSTSSQTIDVDAEASSILNGGAKPSELHALYKSILEREDLIHPVSSSEFSDLLSGLHTRGLIGLEREMSKFSSGSTGSGGGLAPPMMRRSSSSSSLSSNGATGSSTGSGRNSRSPSPNTAASKNGSQAPLYLLYPFTSLHSILSSSSSSTTTPTSSKVVLPKSTEASSICSNLLFKESKRLKRISKMNELLEIELKEKELAPRAGFNGDGLDQNRNNDNNNNFGKGRKNVVDYVGEKDRKGRDDDDIEEEGKDEDHEKNAGLQDEEN